MMNQLDANLTTWPWPMPNILGVIEEADRRRDGERDEEKKFHSRNDFFPSEGFTILKSVS